VPKRDKYLPLTTHLEHCGFEEITMSFEEIDKLVEGLLESAYKYPAPWSNGHGGSLSYGWLNAGYSVKTASIQTQKVTFIKTSIKTPTTHGGAVKQTHTISKPIYDAKLDIETAIQKIRIYHETTEDGVHTRYRSWAHCYKAFLENRHDADMVDYLCLHLAWYLASWGMLRNSFLLNRDYRVHKPLVEAFISGKYEPFFVQEHTLDTIPLTMEASNEILKIYAGNSVTDTLITKILLGIFGCAPAYDDYFKYAGKKYKICTGTWNENSLRMLWDYYELYHEAFENLRQELKIIGLRYTPMKLIDMCFWQTGYDELDRNKKSSEK